MNKLMEGVMPQLNDARLLASLVIVLSLLLTTSTDLSAQSIWLEAECGNGGSLWNYEEDANTSGAGYIYVPDQGIRTASSQANPTGTLTYDITLTQPGVYSLWARSLASNGGNNSFWVTIDNGSWARWDITTSSNWLWDQGFSYNLSAGTHTISIFYREDGTLLDKLFLTNSGFNPSGLGASASNCGSAAEWLEPECGNIGSLISTELDATASNGTYISGPDGSNSTGSAPGATGQVAIDFDIEESGQYLIWGRAIAPNGADNSFWIKVDNGDWFWWNIGITSNWNWDLVNGYNLSAGSHTLFVAYREDDTLLDKLYISNKGDIPSGIGLDSENCDPGCVWLYNDDDQAYYDCDNVGIGTTTPETKLDVRGSVSIGDTESSNSLLIKSNDKSEVQFETPSHPEMRIGVAEAIDTDKGIGAGDFYVQSSASSSAPIVASKSGNVYLVNQDGKVGIGTSIIPAEYTLAVDGTIGARKVKVEATTWADYVFQDDYNLLPLSIVEAYIKDHGHLPNVAPASEVIENGIDLGEMNVKLMEKIEELTLYIIEQDKRLKALEKIVKSE